VPHSILLTNDDGYTSYGLRLLAESLSEICEVTVVCPDRPRSASGFSLTLDNPLRIRTRIYNKVLYHLVSGTPGDCVALGLFKLMNRRPDMVVSGINIGENVSILEFFMSGTMAGAIAASLYGVPAIAFSKVVPGKDVMIVEEVRREFDKVIDIAKYIVLYFLENGLPDDTDLISVNFPSEITKDTKIRVTKLARISLTVRIYEKDDPRGTPYYWIWGEKFGSFPLGTDALETLVKGNISITPIRLEGLSMSSPEESARLEAELTDVLGSVLDE